MSKKKLMKVIMHYIFMILIDLTDEFAQHNTGSVFAAVSLCSGHTAGSGEGNVHTLVSLGRQSPAESFSPPPLPPSLRAELSGALLG